MRARGSSVRLQIIQSMTSGCDLITEVGVVEANKRTPCWSAGSQILYIKVNFFFFFAIQHGCHNQYSPVTSNKVSLRAMCLYHSVIQQCFRPVFMENFIVGEKPIVSIISQNIIASCSRRSRFILNVYLTCLSDMFIVKWLQ